MPRPKLSETEETIALSIRVPKHLSDIIRSLAQKQHRSVSQEIVYLIEFALVQLKILQGEADK
jgi:hypothetical protein